jgi:P27 family predicted phage terminase small subunit
MSHGGYSSLYGVKAADRHAHPNKLFWPPVQRKLPVQQAKAKPTPPKAPKHLRAPTRRWWASVVEAYVLEEHHRRVLTLAGESWDRCCQAREVLHKEGLTYTDRFGAPKARPEVAIERDARLAVARLLRELNLDSEAPADVRPPRLHGTGG